MLIANMAQWAALFGGFGGNDDEDGGGIFGMLFLIIVCPYRCNDYSIRDFPFPRICGRPWWGGNLWKIHWRWQMPFADLNVALKCTRCEGIRQHPISSLSTPYVVG